MKIKLVLSGSGTRFPVFVGAIKRLEEAGYEIEEVIGTSGGSIIAAAISNGMRSDQLIKLCKEIIPKLDKLAGGHPIRPFNEWGYYDNRGFVKEIAKHVPKTFKDCKIPLHIIAVNFDLEEKIVFSATNYPNLEVARACGASSAIPGAFPPIIIDGDMHIDGGIAANFAIDHFGNEATNVVGIFFGHVPGRKKRPTGLFAFFEYLARAIALLIDFKTRDDIEDARLAKHISVQSNIGGLNFKMSPKDVEQMITDGYHCADLWVKKQNE